MPRSKNGDATARETLLAIQERKKKNNNAETTGTQATPPPSPGLNQKKKPTPDKNKETTPSKSPATRDVTSNPSSASTTLILIFLNRVFHFKYANNVFVLHLYTNR